MLERLDYTSNEKSHREWENLLLIAGIRPDPPYSAIYGIYKDDRLVATGARDGVRIKCVAVHPDYQGGEVFHELLSGMITEAFDAGIHRLFLYTTLNASQAFEYLGFRTLAQTENGICFMERGTPSIKDYLTMIKRRRDEYEPKHSTASGPVESIVMNANPFTKGHRALIENALTRAEQLHLFILSEDVSAVPADIRRRLVMEGTADLSGIIYHPTDSYIISRASFPSYFLKKESDMTETQARLDAILFRDKIAPALGITNRTVGEEPNDVVTAVYNQCLAEEFEGVIDLTMMPRIKSVGGEVDLGSGEHQHLRGDSDGVESVGGEVISASRVRKLLIEGQLEKIEALVPPATLKYFESPEGKDLVRSWSR